MVDATFKIALGILAVVALVVFGLGTGWLLWGRWLWQPGVVWSSDSCDGEDQATHSGFFSRLLDRSNVPRHRGSGTTPEPSEATDADCSLSGTAVPGSADQISMDEAAHAVAAYIAEWGADLEIAELMEFEHNYYALVRERVTGMGAMELVIDKANGHVAPEIGPNMMWNARYGMHASTNSQDRPAQVNELTAVEAAAAAQDWLDEHRPGEQTMDHADPFYGYYTIHTSSDGRLEGMLSVHGQTGRVWYHTWHGTFIRMREGEGSGQ